MWLCESGCVHHTFQDVTAMLCVPEQECFAATWTAQVPARRQRAGRKRAQTLVEWMNAWIGTRISGDFLHEGKIGVALKKSRTCTHYTVPTHTKHTSGDDDARCPRHGDFVYVHL